MPSGLALEIGNRQAILKDRFQQDVYRTKLFEALSSYLSAKPTDAVADSDEPVPASIEPALVTKAAQPWTPFKKAAAGVVAIAVIALIVLQLPFPAASPDSELAEIDAEPDNLTQIQQLVQQEDYIGAYLLANQLERQSPDNPALAQLWPEFSDAGSTVLSEPAGAEVWLKDYATPDAD